MPWITSENESAVVVALNSLGDRFSDDINKLGDRLDTAIANSAEERVKVAERLGALEAKQHNNNKLIYYLMGGGGGIGLLAIVEAFVLFGGKM